MGAGIGKYLGGKRKLEQEAPTKDLPADEPRKNRRLGFGSFDGW
jgi:peptidyl-prolyl cis-trans isomerase-like protein 2